MAKENAPPRRTAVAGILVILLLVPFVVSNLRYALVHSSTNDDDTSELKIQQSLAMAELRGMLNISKRQVQSLQAEIQHLKRTKESDTESFKTQINNLKEDISRREQESYTVNEQLEALKKQAAAGTTKQKRMNVLLLYADDWRYDTLGIAGNPIVKTPTLDRLAREGIRFAENCVTTSVCWVSRATLFTGLYLARHKTDRPQVWHGNWTESIYELLRKGGYYVGHVGKWGVWDLPRDRKLHFDIDDSGWHWRELGGRLWHITEKNEYEALRFLRGRDKTMPFFVNVAFFATHAVDGDKRQYMPQNRSMPMYTNDTIPIPITATQESWDRMPYFFGDSNEGRRRWKWRFDEPDKHQSMMKNYYRMASEVDSACEAILKEVEAQGELDNTLVIFTTDNGNFHAEHGLADKWYPHQESIRVPLIIRDPRMPKDKVGTVNDDFTLNIDLAPTILSAAGLTPPQAMMGRDMADLYLKQDPKWRTEFFYEHMTHMSKNEIPASEALVRKDYKYFYWPDWEFEQFFHIQSDPIEEKDIFNSTDETHQKVLKEMKARFHELKTIVNSNETVTL